MIGRISFNDSYAETLVYCLHDRQLTKEELEQQSEETRRRTQNRAEVLYYHRCCGDHRELSRQFREVQKLNFNIRKPVLHVALALPPGEKVSKGQLVALAKDCAKALDFERHQYVVILHKDTEHRHAHIVVNRIGFDGHTVTNQYMLRKVNAYCRAAELKYGLTPTRAMRRYRVQAEKMDPSGHHRVVRLKEQIRQGLMKAHDLETFKKQMQDRGYRVYKTDRGISFKDRDRVLITGSQTEYPWKKIELELAWNDRQKRLVQTQEMRQRRGLRIEL